MKSNIKTTIYNLENRRYKIKVKKNEYEYNIYKTKSHYFNVEVFKTNIPYKHKNNPLVKITFYKVSELIKFIERYKVNCDTLKEELIIEEL